MNGCRLRAIIAGDARATTSAVQSSSRGTSNPTNQVESIQSPRWWMADEI